MDAVAYFSWAVNYKSKMFVKLTTQLQPKGRFLALPNNIRPWQTR